MGFYKPGANHVQDPKMARLHKIIWTLIFSGLITIILGIFVERAGDAMGWMMVAAGGVLTAIGMVLIYVRSTISTETK
jgi:hypothetical protein